MEMTIDRAIKKLKGQQADFNEQYIDFGGINDAFYTAYEIMRKYQKIEEIVNGWDRYRNGVSSSEGDSIYMQKVSEVVEDGND